MSPNAACYEESESVRRIPNRPVELEIRMGEEFWGSWCDQPVAGKINSTTLIVTEHEFLFRFFSPDQSFSQSETDFASYGLRGSVIGLALLNLPKLH